jgi:hypothetical protein
MKFNSRMMTNYLLALILALLAYHFEREMFFGFAIFVAAIWLLDWAIKYPAKHKAARKQATQEKADENEFWQEYKPAFEAIRRKYDPENKWNEGSSIPQAYRDDLRELHLKHRWMLQRRNGYTVTDDGYVT